MQAPSARTSPPPAPEPEPLRAGAAAPLSIVVARDPAELTSRIGAWDALAKRAIQPNPFCEPWLLLPSLRLLDEELEVVLVLRAAAPGAPEELLGVFPLIRRPRFRGLPIPYLSALHHPYSPDSTPLIDARCAPECMSAFLTWLAGRRDAALLEIPRVVADGPVHRALADALDPRKFLLFPDEDYTRAILRKRPGDAEAYLSSVLGGHARKLLRAKERHLHALGKIEFVTLGPDGDVGAWMDEFLALEASGWKGRAGTAMASRAPDREFFRDAVTAAFRRGRLLGQSLRVDGRAIAMKCSLIADDGVLAWKIAFDESFARVSPGMMLEVEAIRVLYDHPELRWLDSCTVRDSRMFQELYTERREMQSLLIARIDGIGGLLVALVPLRRWVRGTTRRAAGVVSCAVQDLKRAIKGT